MTMRQPKPFFRAQTATWYVQIGKRQYNLGPDEDRAWAKYHELMAGKAELKDDPQAVQLLARFLEYVEKHNAASSFAWYSRFVLSFGKCIGERKRVSDVKAHHVSRWLDDNPDWNETTRAGAIRAIKRAFNWACDEEYIKVSPLRKVKRGKSNRRQLVVTAEQWQSILDNASDAAFRDFLLFIRETGCRPQEARLLEARHYDRATGILYIPPEEAKGGVPRPIYPTPAATELIERLAKANPEGALFRDSRGKAWTKNAIVCRFRRLREKLGIEGLCAYTMRHTFGTEALMNGVDSLIVAKLMGHRDVRMLEKHYAHVENPEFLRNAATRARGGSATPPVQGG